MVAPLPLVAGAASPALAAARFSSSAAFFLSALFCFLLASATVVTSGLLLPLPSSKVMRSTPASAAALLASAVDAFFDCGGEVGVSGVEREGGR